MKVLKWKKTAPPNFDRIPEKAGIYILSTSQKENYEYEVKYVGQASDLKARINEHFSRNEKNKELKAHIDEQYIMKVNYSEVDSQSDREGMELYMYNLYEPPYNHKVPPGQVVVKCTLPAALKKRS